MTKIKDVEVIEDNNYNETATLDVTRISYCQCCIDAHSEVDLRLYVKSR